MSDDEKSFRERVEEIREKREQQRNDETFDVGSESQVTPEVEGQPNIPDMEEFLEQFGIELPDCRIIVETDNSRLEFHNQSLYKTQTDTEPMYQLIGSPDKKSPNQGDNSNLDSTPSTSSGSTTKIFGSDSNDSSSNQDESIDFCPGCGENIEYSDNVQYCPSCGRNL